MAPWTDIETKVMLASFVDGASKEAWDKAASRLKDKTASACRQHMTKVRKDVDDYLSANKGDSPTTDDTVTPKNFKAGTKAANTKPSKRKSAAAAAAAIKHEAAAESDAVSQTSDEDGDDEHSSGAKSGADMMSSPSTGKGGKKTKGGKGKGGRKAKKAKEIDDEDGMSVDDGVGRHVEKKIKTEEGDKPDFGALKGPAAFEDGEIPASGGEEAEI